MFRAASPKTCSSSMFEQSGTASNMAPKSGLGFVRAKNVFARVTYGALEHRGNLFEHNVREVSQLLEHNTRSLKGRGLFEQGARSKAILLFVGSGTDDVPPRGVPIRPVWFTPQPEAPAPKRAAFASIGYRIATAPSPENFQTVLSITGPDRRTPPLAA